ncbi:chain length determinant protein tyrosine kinase EpsG [Methylophilus sp. 13]|uniref:chain length determinant protein tyrosine kinase EpsG n=1 Tax=Methylophilus sp. 13 TaxID=2781018 RepID=UPI00188F0E4B|nr:chain length determinant protein tyrosine kinase EpsG [Methylophilus sp. 13]MBF5038006.1 chain length determinant protein tyrosine kinase EpsG [Methylophilus sp. 13]
MSQQVINSNTHDNVSNIGRLLLDMGKITPEDTDRILRKQKDAGIKFGDAAKQLGLITEDDLQQVLSRQFDYAYLPAANAQYSPELVAAYQPFSPQVEGFRALRSQIMFRWLNEGFKAFTVVASDIEEGTSYIAANLAVVFSQLGKKTLLIDANMRKPYQQRIFNLKQPYGLSDILADRTPGADALFNIPDFTNLTVLSAGTVPPNPQELIGRPNFPQLVKYASSIFDVIIIDSPAITQGSDAQMLASVARGSVLVSRMNHTSVDQLKLLKNQIEGAGSNIIGAVVNNY